MFITNLFLIIKWYTHNKNLLIKYFCIISCDLNDEINNEILLFHIIKTRTLARMTFLEFIDWYDEYYENDWEYIKKKNFYGFRIVFYKESSDFIKNNIFPEFPWNENFVNELINNKKHYFSNKYLQIEKENLALKRQNLILLKKINKFIKK